MDFQRYQNEWSDQIMQLVQELRQAPADFASDDERLCRRQLIQNAVSHHADYCRDKAAAARRDVLALFPAPPWVTPLEGALGWVGGWRPTTAFHVIYSECSTAFESRMEDILQGVHHGDLADLPPLQFKRMSNLQMATVRHENQINSDLFQWQDDVTSTVEMVDLARKLDELADILCRADELRLKTMKSLVEMLAAQQAAQFLVAAAKLQFGIRNWGLHQHRIMGRSQY